ncbi:fanconi-associated nuclease 1-like [Fopius arisanus]|uniref:Fanconi-associated nuclease n=2 Tax=Fopius arisanus TaxID=64838 RepID=A0A9R1TA72_9HYME|nr:PREDICTED: fanconi-associated nuclease 1-like [Fopius arisanus]
MKCKYPPDAIIILNDSDEDSHPGEGQEVLPQKASTSRNFSHINKKNLRNLSTTPKSSPSQPPKYCISLDDSSEDDSPPTFTPSKSLQKPKTPSPKRALNFTSCQSPIKRKKINEIMTHEMAKENSFHQYALTTTTSIMESLEVSEIITLESKKQLSFAGKSQSVIKEELLLSEDEWDPDEVDSNVDSLLLSPKAYLKVLRPEIINRNFQQETNNFQQKSQGTDQRVRKAEKLQRIVESAENIVVGMGMSGMTPKEMASPEILVDLEMIGYPRTPKKSSNNEGCGSPRDDVQSPLRNMETPLKRSPSTFSPTQRSPTMRRYRPKKIFKDNTNFETVVDNLNLAKQGAITANKLDLQEIYEKGNFKIQWERIDTSTAKQYDIQDVVQPKNWHSERLLEMIIWVFSEPVNCGYFDEEERDMIFKVMSMSQEEQVLLAIMLKREVKWFRVRKQKYEHHFGENMEKYYLELTKKGFFDNDWEKVDIELIFKLLQVDELKDLCKLMKMNSNVVKPKMIASLKQLLRQKTSHFNTTSPHEALKTRLLYVAGPILKLSEKFVFLIHRILTLYYPNHDPEEKLSDVFHKLSEVHFGNKTFPSTPIIRFPLFKSRQSLSDYTEAKLVWMKITQVMKETNKGPSHWEAVRDHGKTAYKKLKEIMNKIVKSPEDSTSEGRKSKKIPSHIARFTSTYVWSKILILSFEAFKRLKYDGCLLVKSYIEFLLNNRADILINCGKLYKELTLIEMSHLKDLERSAEMTLEAFSVTSSIIDQAEMIERAKKLSSRVNGISPITKNKLKDVLDQKEEEFVCIPKEVEIEVTKVDRAGCGGKSMWQLNIGDEEKGYGNVETVAMSHYATVGYPKGIHCEGALPVTLFACLFWREIYELSVPGAFVSLFQDAPLDLFGSSFFENRREALSKKVENLEKLQNFSSVLEEMTIIYRDLSGLQSIMCSIVDDPELFHEIITCLGKNGVLGICKRMVLGGYVNWRSGFPDLFVWNEKSMKCKVVEVKGPGDSLSVKQKLWIKYLQEIGVKVEVCLVKAKQMY